MVDPTPRVQVWNRLDQLDTETDDLIRDLLLNEIIDLIDEHPELVADVHHAGYKL